MHLKFKVGRGSIVDLLYFAGSAIISTGIGMLLLPAGLIAGGVFAIAAAVFISLGGEGDDHA